MSEEQKKKRGCSWLQAVVGLFVALIVISALMPTIHVTSDTSLRTAEASNCRQIIAALRLYAIDHQGKYPDGHEPEPQTANQAFRILICEGILEDERVFGVRSSLFVQDNEIGDPPDYLKALEAGENYWAMTKGAKENSDRLTPLVFDNPSSVGWPPMWNADAAGKKVKGRAWRGGKIIVGFNDGSVELIKLESTKGTSVGPAKDADGKDIFTRAAESMEILDIER